jgi:glycosyltransferase involved in cell wall biosynthesis
MFSWQYAIQPLLICKTKKIETILAPRGMLQTGALQFKSFKKTVFLKILKCVDAFKFTTFQATDAQEKEDILLNIGINSKVVQVQNFAKAPIDKPRSIDKNKGQLKLVFISRIVPKKNLDFILNCISHLPKNSIEFTIYGEIGDEQYGNKCINLISELNKNQKITYKGAIKNNEVNDELQKYHLFILLSHGENFGHAIYEALAAARPVLISNKTPWKNLNKNQQGWDVDITNQNETLNALLNAINWEQDSFELYCNNALQLAKNYFENKDIKTQYLKLFS